MSEDVKDIFIVFAACFAGLILFLLSMICFPFVALQGLIDKAADKLFGEKK